MEIVRQFGDGGRETMDLRASKAQTLSQAHRVLPREGDVEFVDDRHRAIAFEAHVRRLIVVTTAVWPGALSIVSSSMSRRTAGNP